MHKPTLAQVWGWTLFAKITLLLFFSALTLVAHKHNIKITSALTSKWKSFAMCNIYQITFLLSFIIIKKELHDH